MLMGLPRAVFRSLAALCFSTLPSFAQTLDWRQLPPVPDALGLAAPFAGASGGALLVAGGANFPNGMPWEGGKKVWHDRVWVLDQPDGAWREAGKLPRPLAYGVSVSTRDAVVCVGGSDAERHYATVFRLTWKTGALRHESLPDLPIALAGAAGALVGDTLIVAGGAEQPGEQAATNRVFALDLAAAKPTWRALPSLPGKSRMLAMAAAHEGGFYLFGGCALEPKEDGKVGRVYLREAWRYREGAGWQRLGDLPKANAAAPSPVPRMAGRLLLLAGDDGSLAGFTPVEKHPGFPATILAYEPALDRWSEAGETPAPRATVPCVEWRGAFVFPSGEVRPGVRSPEVWSLRPSRP